MAGLPQGTYLIVVDIGPCGPTVGSITPIGKLEDWRNGQS